MFMEVPEVKNRKIKIVIGEGDLPIHIRRKYEVNSQ